MSPQPSQSTEALCVAIRALLARSRQEAALVASLLEGGGPSGDALETLCGTIAEAGRLLAELLAHRGPVTTLDEIRWLVEQTRADIAFAEVHAAVRLRNLAAQLDEAAQASRRNRAYSASAAR